MKNVWIVRDYITSGEGRGGFEDGKRWGGVSGGEDGDPEKE